MKITPPRIEMSLFPAGQPRSDDAALERAEAGGHTPAPTQDTQSSRRWTAKQMLKAGASIGLGMLAVGGTSAGVTYALTKPHGGKGSSLAPSKLPATSAGLPATSAGLPPPPVVSAAAACVVPTMKVNGTSSAALSQPVTSAGPRVSAPLYGSSGQPQAADIVGLFNPTVIGAFGIPGTVRANILQGLAASSPDFIQSMITPIGTNAYSVRLYDRNEGDNTFSQVNVRVDVGEFDPQVVPVRNGQPMWWALVLQAGAKLDNYIQFVPATVLDGDRNDAAQTRRQAVESIVGAHVEITSGDELDALRIAEVNAASPSIDLMTADEIPAGTAPQMAQTGALFEAKNDNWPSFLARMSDTRNIALVNFHQPLDFKVEALTRNMTVYTSAVTTSGDQSFTDYWRTPTTITTASNASITVSSGGAHYFSGDSFLSVAIDVPGEQTRNVYTGPSFGFTVVDAEAGAVWLQQGPPSYNGYATYELPFKVPTDLLELATSEVTIARRPCASDADYQQPGLSLA